MSVTPNDIKIFGSGTHDIGGVKGAAEIPSGQLHALYDAVRASEALTGMTDYRCIYIQNDNPTDTLRDALVYVLTDPTTAGVSIMLGRGTAAKNNLEAALSSENTPPLGVNFVAANDPTGAVQLGSLDPGDFISLWIQRSVAANTPSAANDQFTLQIVGETV